MNVSFERKKDGKDEWLTPPDIIKSLGIFDLDPCAPIKRPWDTAKNHYDINDNGLIKEWEGRIWLNPPYDGEAIKWIARLVDHGNGIGLTFARTDNKMFFDYIWGKAQALLFIKGRLKFYNVEGNQYHHSAGAPSVLIAYGQNNVLALEKSKIKGKIIRLFENM